MIDHLGDRVTAQSIDEPLSESGEWFFDIVVAGREISVAWRADQGYGLFTSEDDGYGSRPDEVYRSVEAAARRIGMLSRSDPDVVNTMHLGDLRRLVDLPQTTVASRMGKQQAAISRLERHADTYVSSIQEYVAALGGTVVLSVRFNDFEAPIALAGRVRPRSKVTG